MTKTKRHTRRKTAENLVKVGYRIPARQDKLVETLATKEGVSMSEIYRKLIDIGAKHYAPSVSQ
jgi:hypothetical protein